MKSAVSRKVRVVQEHEERGHFLKSEANGFGISVECTAFRTLRWEVAVGLVLRYHWRGQPR